VPATTDELATVPPATVPIAVITATLQRTEPVETDPAPGLEAAVAVPEPESEPLLVPPGGAGASGPEASAPEAAAAIEGSRA
jgi:hypothetical protein